MEIINIYVYFIYFTVVPESRPYVHFFNKKYEKYLKKNNNHEKVSNYRQDCDICLKCCPLPQNFVKHSILDIYNVIKV